MTRDVALVYVRVSRLERDDRQRIRDGDAKLRALSPTTQIQQVKALPALKGKRIEVFEDLHRSGKNTKRPALEQLRERMRSDDVAFVAVWSISRLGRSVADLYELLEEMQAASVAFVSAKESIDTGTAYGRAVVGVLAVLAQFERELTSERISANWEQAASAGKLIGSVPHGYRRKDGVVVVDEEAAKLVRLIYRQYATGRFSYRALAQWLNENGHRPPNADGHHGNGQPHAEIFAADAVKYLLRNERYVGRVIYKPRRIRAAGSTDHVVKADFPAIVDKATWEACEKVRTKNAAHNGLRYSRTARYSLTGLLRCQRCGGTVHGIRNARPTATYSYYVCRSRYGSRSCSQPLARAEQLEEQMREWLAAVRMDDNVAPKFAAKIRAAAAKSPRRSDPEKQRKALEERIARLDELYELGRVARRDYATRREHLTSEVESLRPTSEPHVQVRETIATLVDDWEAMDAGVRRQLLESIFTEIKLEDGALVSATPRAGWQEHIADALEAKTSVCDGRRRRESNPR
jgi:site-specific DNA recombinase